MEEESMSQYNASNETSADNSTSSSSSSSSALTIWQILSLGILVMETMVGSFVNGLMVTVNLISLVTHRQLGSNDSILTCLGLSRFVFMWLVLVLYFVSYVTPNNTDAGNNLQYAWLFFSDMSLWCATWLSTFYCVKIVNIRGNLFTALKTHFDHLVPFLMLACVAISAGCSNSTAYNGVNQTFNMSKYDNHKNSAPLAGTSASQLLTLSVVGSIPPFSLFCVCVGLVIGSLQRHMRKMRGQERTGFREPSLDAHYRAVKMMAAFFIFFALYLMAFILYAAGKLGKGLLGSVATFLIGAYPSLHSVLLVIGNHKLKYTLLWILQKAHCYRKEVIQTISD